MLITGRARRGFFVKRLEAALAFPDAFVVVGAGEGDRLDGYVIARVQVGEFGEERPSAVLDAIGVDPSHQGKDLGKRLLEQLEEGLRKRGVRELRTEIGWAEEDYVRFFSSSGFSLAPRVVLERPLSEAPDL